MSCRRLFFGTGRLGFGLGSSNTWCRLFLHYFLLLFLFFLFLFIFTAFLL